MRVLALSDLHTDFAANREWLSANLCTGAYRDDLLIVAGDVSDDLEQLTRTLAQLREQVAELMFVPGNHDLWVREERSSDSAFDSLEKLERVLERCRSLGVHTRACSFGTPAEPVSVVALASWYSLPFPAVDADDSLFVQGRGTDLGLSVWADTRHVRWPAEVERMGPARWMAARNREWVDRAWPGTVISVSHFLPRRELIPPAPGAGGSGAPRTTGSGRRVPFNFSRVAGSAIIDRQLRELGASVHVYGHQHRNRDRVIDGVRYVSSCLGYDKERRRGLISADGVGPACVWSHSPGPRLAGSANGRSQRP